MCVCVCVDGKRSYEKVRITRSPIFKFTKLVGYYFAYAGKLFFCYSVCVILFVFVFQCSVVCPTINNCIRFSYDSHVVKNCRLLRSIFEHFQNAKAPFKPNDGTVFSIKVQSTSGCLLNQFRFFFHFRYSNQCLKFIF